jgi:hypothetical protein
MLDSFVAVSDRDKQRALELVLQSRTFVRCDQLRAFLQYVCSMEIEGRGEQITGNSSGGCTTGGDRRTV